jgi:thiamine biosynthesis lipoprotein
MTSSSAPAEVRRARPLLGTLVEIRAAADLPWEQLHAAVDAAFAEVQRVHTLMSFHLPDSEVSLLNREALRRPVQVHAHTYAVLQAALDWSRRSDGAFDIAVGTRLQRWGYLPTAEDPTTTEADWTAIHLEQDRSVRFRQPLRIDLGGIAKGYAVDCAVTCLRQAGVESILVNAGGDLRIAGKLARRVGLRRPQQPLQAGHALLLREEALASSGAYFSRQLRGVGEVSPLLDPRSGRPYLGSAGVSVRAPTCLQADVLTKVVLFGDPALREQLLADCGAQAMLLGAAAAA